MMKPVVNNAKDWSNNNHQKGINSNVHTCVAPAHIFTFSQNIIGMLRTIYTDKKATPSFLTERSEFL